MKSPKNSGHREKRDTNRKELAVLKSENRHLHKKVARLEKELRNTVSETQLAATDLDWDIDENQSASAAPEPKCPLCGSLELGSYRTPGGKLLIACKKCKRYKAVA